MLLEPFAYFISVAKHLNFTKAANELFVTQPTVSNQIAKLEEEVGVKLFISDKQAVYLTPAGKALLKEAENILNITNHAIVEARKTGSNKTGTLKLGAVSYIIKKNLPSFILYFQQKYPEIDIDLVTMNAEPLRKALISGDIDIGLTLSMSLNNSPQLEWENISTDNVVLEMNLANPIVNKPDLDLSDLADESFIALSRDQSPYWYDFTLHIFLNRGITPKIERHTTLMQTLYILAENNLGIAISSRDASKPYRTENLRTIELEGDDTKFNVALAWNKDNYNTIIKTFINEFYYISELPHQPNNREKDLIIKV